jgi:hypothetical protein
MPDPTTISEQIEQSGIDGISSASNGRESASKRSISELIAADQYVKGQAAKAKNHLGLSFRRIVPGGTG